MAVAKFATACLLGVGFLSHITFRQSLGDHDMNEFMDTWKNKLTPEKRLTWFFVVCITGLISASLCLSLGV